MKQDRGMHYSTRDVEDEAVSYEQLENVSLLCAV